jgi:TetR/AcrR family transcriptional regulator, transcriptional repressor for nem operon
MAASDRPDGGTTGRILDVAEGLVQVRGFNAFSYADVAAELHLTKASLHYHFAGKAELGQALVARYSERFADGLAQIDRTVERPPDKLDAYVNLYADVLAARRMCLCGMLAAEYPTLPASMQEAVRAFIDLNQDWLTGVFDQGRADGSLQVAGSSADTAVMLIAGLEGAMLVARPYGDMARFRAAAGQMLAGVVSPEPVRPTGPRSRSARRS